MMSCVLASIGVLVPFPFYYWLWTYPSIWVSLVGKGRDPAKVMAQVSHLLKLIQFISLYSVSSISWPPPLFFWPLFLFGQFLNFRVYQLLGESGTYYGVRFGKNIPWVTEFPFGYISDPQYVGSIMSLLACLSWVPFQYIFLWVLGYMFMIKTNLIEQFTSQGEYFLSHVYLSSMTHHLVGVSQVQPSPRTFPSRLSSVRSPPSSFNLSLVRKLFCGITPSSFSANFLTLNTENRTKSSFKSKSSMAEVPVGKAKADLQIFDTEEDLSVSLAKYTAELSEKFTKERGAFTVVVSGGSLIKSLRKLVESPYVDSIDWAKWHVFWVDERVVPKDHDDSNYKLAYDGFLSKVPVPPGQVYAINDALSAEGAADDYETCLKQLVKIKVVDLLPASGFPKFDLMLLGMGPDGHVASLFPGHPLVNENKRWVTYIKDSPKPPPERITFTFPVINSAAKIAMVVVGAGKSDVVRRAVGSDTGSDMLPVQMVSPADGATTWFLDKDAASKL
ncbi:6-phosphogluconolactonase [Thalictrum thalictroides]|uniref:Phosphatidyl-N-methylethanolamine N-methyltransferase n=1 Tax=Thalictrum thalictroides TaxID=46969 RepID=A0A7J6X3Z2_THATH|nr:6-phosphogluconolactonase [Thalictrum thalictroides]